MIAMFHSSRPVTLYINRVLPQIKPIILKQTYIDYYLNEYHLFILAC